MAESNLAVITAEDLDRLPDSNPVFRSWVWRMYIVHHERLRAIVRTLIKFGLATDVASALSVLQDLSKDGSAPRYIAISDLEGKKAQHQLFARLREASGEKAPNKEGEMYHLFGTKGHALVPDVFSGKAFVRLEEYQKDSGQMWLFEHEKQIPLFGGQSRVQNGDEQGKHFPSAKLFSNLERKWKECAKLVEKNGSPPLLIEAWQSVGEFEAAINLLLYPYVRELRHLASSEAKYLAFLTLLTWATVLRLYRSSGPRAFFSEVPLLELGRGFGGGRIDAVEVSSIAGKPPNRSQARALFRMAEHRYGSAGVLFSNLRSTFGHELGINIIDWKFAIGDGIRNQMLSPADLAGPPLRHKEQIERYLTLFSLSSAYTLDGSPKRAWHPDENIHLKGVLTYFLPTVKPIIHEVEMAPAEKEVAFIQRVVGPWKLAEQRAMIRAMNSHLVGQLLRLLDGKSSKNGSNGHGAEKQTELFTAGEPVHAESEVKQLVQKYRRSLDEKEVQKKGDKKKSTDRKLKTRRQSA